ncbi:VOC family protein [Enterococcus sp. LJL99]
MKLSMVGIIVKEMERAIAFYDCLGLVVSERFGEEYVELSNATIRISLNTQSMVKGVYGFEPNLSGERLELAFELTDKNEVDALYQKIKDNDYAIIKAPWSAPWGQYYALVADPDGNILSLFSNN